MSLPELSLQEIINNAAGTPLEASLKYTFAQHHDARLKAVRQGVDFACNSLEEHKNKKQGLTEDEITVQICEQLSMLNFQARHDMNVGGHCDIVIKGKDHFLWLGEAKKHDSYDWLDKGFKQLSTRYSTGVNGQDNGELLIYCYVKDALTMLEKWKKRLLEKHPYVLTTNPGTANELLFFSCHKHDSSGLDFHVRHKAIALHWDPKDKQK